MENTQDLDVPVELCGFSSKRSASTHATADSGTHLSTPVNTPSEGASEHSNKLDTSNEDDYMMSKHYRDSEWLFPDVSVHQALSQMQSSIHKKVSALRSCRGSSTPALHYAYPGVYPFDRAHLTAAKYVVPVIGAGRISEPVQQELWARNMIPFSVFGRRYGFSPVTGVGVHTSTTLDALVSMIRRVRIPI